MEGKEKGPGQTQHSSASLPQACAPCPSAHLGNARGKQVSSGTMRNTVKNKNIGFYEKLLPKRKKAKQSKKTHKTPNSLPAWELLLFVIYSRWVGRKRRISGWPDRPGPASIQTVHTRCLTSAERSGGDKSLDSRFGAQTLCQGDPTNPITQRSSLTQAAQ